MFWLISVAAADVCLAIQHVVSDHDNDIGPSQEAETAIAICKNAAIIKLTKIIAKLAKASVRFHPQSAPLRA